MASPLPVPLKVYFVLAIFYFRKAIAQTPEKCPPVAVVSSAAGSLTVKVSATPLNAATCRIYRDDCNAGTTFTQIYDGVCTGSASTSGLVADANCRFYCRGVSATSSVGPSSDIVTHPAAGKPVWTVQNTVFTKRGSECVTLEWSLPDANGSPILCYSVARDMSDGNWVTIVACSDNPNLYTATSCGLSASVTYRFRIYAANRVGTSDTPSSVSVLLKNMYAAPDSVVSTAASSVSAGTDHTITVQAKDPITKLNEAIGFSNTNYGARIFVARFVNPCKLDDTGELEVPLTANDPGYIDPSLHPLNATDIPLSVSSFDENSGQYKLIYNPSKIGKYSVVIRSLTPGGLYGQYWDNQWFFGSPRASRQDPLIDFDWDTGNIVGYSSDFVSIRWTGFVHAQYTEEYTFYVKADDNVRLWVDNQLLIDKWSDTCCSDFWGKIRLVQNKYHFVRLEYRELTGTAHVKLWWSSFTLAKELVPPARAYHGEVIQGQPWFLDVTMGRLEPFNCIAYGAELSDSVAGWPSTFYIQAKDLEGNSMTDVQSAVFTATFTKAALTVSVVSNPVSNSGTDGLHEIRYSLTSAGKWTVAIRSSGRPIKNSGVTLTIVPSYPSAATTTVTAGLESAVDLIAGTDKTITVLVRDAYSNEITTDKARLTAALEWLQYSTSSPLDLWDDSSLLTDQFGKYFSGRTSYDGVGGGKYSVVLNSLRAGDLKLHLKLDGIAHILGSPFSVAAAHATTAYGPACITQANYPASTAVAGADITVKFQLRDAFGNVLSSRPAGANVEVVIGPPPVDTGFCVHQGSGVERCVVVPTRAGRRFLSMRVDGIEISRLDLVSGSAVQQKGPFEVTVSPGSVLGSTSEIVGTKESYIAGVYSPALLLLKDNFSNPLTGGGANVLASLNREDLALTNNLNGSYTVNVGAKKAGRRVRLSVLLNDVEILNTANLTTSGVDVLPAPADQKGTDCALPITYVAGQPLVFSCIPKDEFYNMVNDSGLHFMLQYKPLFANDTTLITFNGSYAPILDGSYSFNVTHFTKGTFSAVLYLAERGGLLSSYFRTPSLQSLVTNFSDLRHKHDPEFAYSGRAPVIDFVWADGQPPMESMPGDYWSLQLSGWLLPKATGMHTIFLESDWGTVLTVNGIKVADAWEDRITVTKEARLRLEEGVPVPIHLQYRHMTSTGYLRVYWATSSFGKEIVPAANLLAPLNALNVSQQLVYVQSDIAWMNSTAFGNSLSVMTAGLDNTFTVQTLDKYGNTRDTADSPILAQCPSGLSDLPTCRLRAYLDSSPSQATGTFTYSGQGGRYTVKVNPANSGSWKLHVQVYAESKWQDIADSPWSVQVVPNTRVPANTLIEGVGQSQAVAGVQTCFNVTMRDSANNNVYGDGSSFDPTVSPPTTNLGSMTYLGLGKFTYCYTQTVAQTWTGLTVTVDSQSFPLSIVVSPAPVEPGSSRLYSFVSANNIAGTAGSSSASGVAALTPGNVTLTAADQYGNVVSSEDTVEVVCFGLGPQNFSEDSHPIQREQYHVFRTSSNSWELQTLYSTGGYWKLDCSVVKQGGLQGAYYSDSAWGGRASTLIEPQMCLNWGEGLVGSSSDNYVSARWDGFLRVPVSCNYTIHMDVNDGGFVWLEDKLILSAASSGTYSVSNIPLYTSKLAALQVSFFDKDGLAKFCLSYSCPEMGWTTKTAIPTQNLFHSPTKLQNLNPSPRVLVYRQPQKVHAFYRQALFSTATVTVAWWPPVDAGYLAIIGYTLTRQRDDGAWTTVSSSIGASTYTFTQNSLNTDVPYRYRLLAKSTLGGDGVYTEITTFPCALPDQPVDLNLVAADSTLNTFTFSLGAPITTGCSVPFPPSIGYRLSWNDGMGGVTLNNRKEGLASTTSASATATSLVSGRVYKFAHQWYTQIGYSPLSNVTEFRCCEFKKPGKVTFVERDLGIEQSAKRIGIRWVPPADTGSTALLKYAIYYSPGDADRKAETLTAHQLSYLFEGDHIEQDSPDDIWRFQVVAVNSAGEGPRSDRITLKALNTPNAPLARDGSFVKASSNTSITLHWNAPIESIVSSYFIYVDNGNGSDIDIVAYNGTGKAAIQEATYTAPLPDKRSNLTSGNPYRFQIFAVNEAGAGTKTSIITEYAASRPGRPGKPYADTSATTTSSIKVRWAAADPMGRSADFDLKYVLERKTWGGGWTVLASGIGDAFYTDTTSITANERYTYRVYGTNGVSAGEINYSQEATLMASAVNAAPSTAFRGSTRNSISIAWTAPASPPVVSGYRVYVNGNLSYDGTGITATSTFTLTDCTLGQWYDIKVTALSPAGESSLSSCCSKPCGRQPTVMSPPALVYSSTHTIKVSWVPPGDTGGLPLTGYVVQRAAAGSTTYSTLAGVTASTLSYVDSVALTSGNGYKYRVYAQNDVNSLTACNTAAFSSCDADASGYSLFYACDSPSSPSVISRVTPATSASLITITWTPVEHGDTGGCPVTGYRVYMNDGLNGALSLKYDGSEKPNVFAVNMTDLVAGRMYWVQMSTITIAGEGNRSSIVGMRAAQPPGKPSLPGYLDDGGSPHTEIRLSWGTPSQSGGGGIVMWEIAHDKGESAAHQLLHRIQVCDVAQSAHTMTGLVAGTYYRVKVRAHGACPLNTTEAFYACPNACTQPGEWSDVATLVASTLPSEFTIAADASNRTNTSAAVTWTPCTVSDLSTCVSSWYTPLLFFEAWRDDCQGGDFIKVGTVGPGQSYYAYEDLPTGQTCGLRIKANNSRGGSFSTNTLYAVVAGAPMPPPPPTRANTTKKSINLKIVPPADNGGVPLSKIYIYRDNTPTSTDISTLVATLASPNLFSYTDEGVVVGRAYHYQLVAENSESILSHRSLVATFVAAAAPDQPPSVAWVSRKKTSINFRWSPPASNGGSDIYEYVVYMNEGLGGDVKEVHRGPQTVHTATGLIPGRGYNIQVSAVNMAGESEKSNTTLVLAVEAPSAPQSLRVSATSCASETLTLSWTPPSDNGGCSIEQYKIYEGSTVVATLTSSISYTVAPTYKLSSRDCNAASGPWLFSVTAVNCETESPESLGLYTRNADSPGKVTGLSALPLSSTSLKYSWTALSVSVAGIGSASFEVFKGYELWVDDGKGGEYSLVYNGYNKPYTLQYVHRGLTQGLTYRAYVLGVNTIGKSTTSLGGVNVIYTDMAYLPAEPTDLSVSFVSSSCVSVDWTPSVTGSGSPINYYQLEYAPGPLFAAWSDSSMGYGQNWLNTTVCSLTPGTTYQFRVRAVSFANVTGNWSSLVSHVVGTPPSIAPANLRRINSTRESMVWAWDQIPTIHYGGVASVGYRFYVNNGTADDPSLVFDGIRLPNVRTYNHTKLTCGRTYIAKVSAISTIGEGVMSSTTSVQLAVPPSKPLNIKLVMTNTTLIRFSWEEPLDTGCFLVSKYKVERDCGSGFSTLTSSLEAEPYPEYLDYATPPSGDTLCVYRVSARNSALDDFGDYSDYLAAYAASPAAAPQNVFVNHTSRVSCFFEWKAPASLGGSSILDYAIYVDDGNGGNLDRRLVTSATHYTLTGLTTSRTYRFHIAAVTSVGEGSLTPIHTCTAADVVGPPHNVSVSTVGQTKSRMFRVSWYQPSDDGGSLLLGYRVMVNTSCSAYSKKWDAATTQADIPCSAGNTYLIQVQAYTEVGWGNSSQPILHDCAAVPTVPQNVTLKTNPFESALSVTDTRTKDTVSLSWAAPSDSFGSDVLKYNVYVDDGAAGGVYTLAKSVRTLYATINSLVLNRIYRFRVSAVNGAGEGPQSTQFSALVRCVSPAPPSGPTKLAGDPWSLTIGWPEADSSSCGSVVDKYQIYREGMLVHPVSNSFAVAPFATDRVTSDGLRVTFTAAGSGFVYAAVINSTEFPGSEKPSVTDVVLNLNSKVMPCRVVREQIPGSVSTTIELRGCKMQPEGVYSVSVYVEGASSVDYNGQLYPPVTLNRGEPIQISNWFIEEPSVSSVTKDGLQVRFRAQKAAGRAWVHVLNTTHEYLGNITAVRVGHMSLCGKSDFWIVANQTYLNLTGCNMRGGTEHHLWVYIEDSLRGHDGSLAGPISIKAPPSNGFGLPSPFVFSTPRDHSVSISFRTSGIVSNGKYWAELLASSDIEFLSITEIKTQFKALCGVRNVPAAPFQAVTATLTLCNVQRGQTYWAYVYVEDAHGLDDGTMSDAIEVNMLDYNISNYFVINPHTINWPSVSSVELKYQAFKKGRTWAAVVPAASAVCVSGDELKSPKGAIANCHTGEFNSTDQPLIVNFTNCNLKRDTQYEAFVYLEDELGLFPGTLSPGFGFSLGMSNWFLAPPRIEFKISAREIRLTVDGGNRTRGLLFASIVSPDHSDAIDVAAMRAGTFAVGGDQCRVKNDTIGPSVKLYTLNCTLEHGKNYVLHSYIEDHYALGDGQLATPVPFSVPPASFKFIYGPKTVSSATADGVTIGFTAQPEYPVWTIRRQTIEGAFASKVWTRVVEAAAASFVRMSNIKNVTLGMGNKTSCARHGVSATNYTELVLSNCSLQYGKSYVAVVYVESTDALNDGVIGFTPSFTVIATNQSNYFLNRPVVELSSVNRNLTNIRFRPRHPGYAWATVLPVDAIPHIQAAPLLSMNATYRTNLLAGHIPSGLQNCTVALNVTNITFVEWNLTNCTMTPGHQYVASAFLATNSTGEKGHLELSAPFTVPVSNSFHTEPYLLHPPAADYIEIEFACNLDGFYWVALTTLANASFINPITIRDASLLYGPPACRKEMVACKAGVKNAVLLSDCGMRNGSYYSVVVNVEGTIQNMDGTIGRLDISPQVSNSFAVQPLLSGDVVPDGFSFTFTAASAGKYWTLITDAFNSSHVDAHEVRKNYPQPRSAVTATSCTADAVPITAHWPAGKMTVTLSGCSLQRDKTYYLYVYVDNGGVDYGDGSVSLPLAIPVPKSNHFSVAPTLTSTPSTTQLSVAFTPASNGKAWGAITYSGVSLTAEEIKQSSPPGAQGGASSLFQGIGVTGGLQVEWNFYGTYVVGTSYYVWVYVDDGVVRVHDGTFAATQWQIPTYVSNSFAESPVVSGAVSLESLTVLFTAKEAAGTAWIFVTRPLSGMTTNAARVLTGSLGNSTCKKSEYSIGNTQESVSLSSCGFPAGQTLHLYVYVEGHFGATSNSLADGSVHPPVAFNTPSVASASQNTLELRYRDTGVTPGESYVYHIRPVSAVGVGYPSPGSAPLLAAGPPSAPGKPIATSKTRSSVFLQWGPPDDGGSSVLSYSLQMKFINGNWSTVFTGSDPSFTKTSLVSGSGYVFRLAATNAVGTSSYSEELTLYACSAPSAPYGASVRSRATTSVVIDWQSPLEDGGCTDIEYLVQWDGADQTPLSGNAFSVYGLSAATTYTFRVRAGTTGGGTSDWTALYEVVAATAPAQVTLPTVTANSQSAISLSWSQPSVNGGSGITRYSVLMNDGLGGTTYLNVSTVLAPSTSVTISSGLVSGRQYCFQVGAQNSATFSSNPHALLAATKYSSHVCAYAADLPSAPLLIVLKRSVKRQVSVEWSVPLTDGGALIQFYEASVYPSAGPWMLLATTSAQDPNTVYDGCTEGELYQFRVRARNAAGWGPYSALFPGYCAIPPAVPLNLQRLNSTRVSIGLQWSPPVENNGATVTQYTLYAKNLGDVNADFVAVKTTASTFHYHYPLTIGSHYEYAVTAWNDAGESNRSSTVNATATSEASAPRSFAVKTRTRMSLVFSWLAPLDDGGSGVTKYQVFYGLSESAVSTLGWEGSGLESAPIYLNTGIQYYFQVATCNKVNEIFGTDCVRSSVLAAYMATVVPSVPTLQIVNSTSTSMLLTWLPVSDDGGSPVTSYTVYHDRALGQAIDTVACSGSLARECYLTGIAGGFDYRFQLVVENGAGFSERGDVTSFRTCDTPPSPTGLRVTGRSPGVISLAWDRISTVTLCTILGYEVLASQKSSNESCALAEYSKVGETANVALTSYTYITSDTLPYCIRVRATNYLTQRTEVAGNETSDLWAFAATAPGKPGPVTLVSVDSNHTWVNVQWSAPEENGGYPIRGYIVERNDGQGGSEWLPVANTTSNNTLEVVGLTAGYKYAFRVRGINLVTQFNMLSDLLNCCWSDTAYLYAASAPRQPYLSDVAASDSSRTTTGLTLKWVFNDTIQAMAQDAGLPVSGFKVYRSAGGPSYLDINVLVFNANFTPLVYSHHVTSLTAGLMYRFAVTAINPVGESAIRQWIQVTCCKTPATMAAPTAGDPVAGQPTHLNLDWVAPTDTGGLTITGYKVYRDNGDTDDITNLVYSGVALTTQVTSGLTAAKTYRFVVVASNVVGDSPSSPPLSYFVCGQPDAPQTFTASDFTDTSVKLTWTGPSTAGGSGCYIQKYVIERREGASSPYGTVYTTASAGERSVTIADLAPAASYTFRIWAYNKHYVSSASASVTLNAGAVPTQPGKPYYVSGSNDPAKFKIAWTSSYSALSLLQYQVAIRKCSDTGVSATLTAGTNLELEITTTSYASLVKDVIWCVQVRAENANGFGDFAPTLRIYASGAPNRPPPVNYTSSTQSSFSVYWGQPALVSGDAPIETFEVRYSDQSNDPGTLRTSTIYGSKNNLTLEGLTAGHIYRFEVRACNLFTCGAWSQESDQVVGGRPDAPSTPTVTSRADNQVVISWTHTGSDGGVPVSDYHIFKSTDNGATFSLESSVDSTTTTATISCTNGEALKFSVAALNGVGGVHNTDPGGVRSPVLSTYCAATPDTPPSAPTVTATSSTVTVSLYGPSVGELHNVAHGGWKVFIDDTDDSVDSYTEHRVTDTALSSWTLSTGVVAGHNYRAKIQVCSVASCSADSSVSASVIAASVPDAPTGLYVKNSTNSYMVIKWVFDGYNGGSPVTSWLVEASIDSGTSYSPLMTVDTAHSNFTYREYLHMCEDTLGSDKRLQYIWYKVYAQNSGGKSGASNAVYGRCSAPPHAIAAPSLVSSSLSSVTFSWVYPSQTILNNALHKGYRICATQTTETCIDTQDTSLSQYTWATTSGLTYDFTVAVVTEVGRGLPSPPLTQLSASLPDAPFNLQILNTSNQNITFTWNHTVDGGSGVSRFHVYTSSDLGVTYTKHGYGVSGNEYLSREACDQGQVIYAYVTATSLAGESGRSNIVNGRCCLSPEAPSAPTLVSSTSTTVTVAFGIDTSSAVRGLYGCSLTGWRLWYDNGQNGPFTNTSIISRFVNQYTLTGLTSGGLNYNIKVQALSDAGEGYISPALNVSVADKPSPPNAPMFHFSDNIRIIFNWTMTGRSNGGATITGYRIYASSDCLSWPTLGDSAGYVTEVGNPTGGTYTQYCNSVKKLLSNYEKKEICFAVTAVNSAGESGLSGFLWRRCSAPPDQPSSPLQRHTVVDRHDGIGVSWLQPASDTINHALYQGIRLYYDDGISGPFTYVDVVDTATTSYTITGLTPGLAYRLKFAYVTDAGVGEASEPVTFIAAALPSAPGMPTFILFNATHNITVGWTEPADNGGSAVSVYGLSFGDSYTTFGPPRNVYALNYSQDCRLIYTVDQSGNNVTRNLLNDWVYVRVHAINEAGRGPNSEVARLFCQEAPEAPYLTELVSESRADRVALSWTTNSTVSKNVTLKAFNVYLGTFESTISLLTTIYDTSQNHYYYYGGTSGQTLYFQVAAVSQVGVGRLSGILTTRFCGLPATPTAPYRTSSNFSHNLIKWDTPAQQGCPITGFRLFQNHSGRGFSTVYPPTAVDVADPFDWTLNNSFAGQIWLNCSYLADLTTVYFLRVYSTKGYRDSPSTTLLCAGVPDKMDPPTRYSNHSLENGTIALNWTIPGMNNGSLIGFKVYRNSGGSTSMNYSHDDNTCGRAKLPHPQWCVITGLTTGVDYKIQIAAVNSIGEGALSDIVVFTAGSRPEIPIAPYNTSNNTGSGWVMMQWAAPRSNGLAILRYKHYIFNLDLGGQQVHSWDGPIGYPPATYVNVTKYWFPNLQLYTSYRMCVAAENLAGPSNCSALSGNFSFVAPGVSY